jgi:phage terminase large subunit
VLERAISEEGHRILVCRKVAKTCRQSCYKNLLEQLVQHYPDSGYKVNKTDMVISFPNGSEILFAGLDDVEKLKSIQSITAIWIEEASEILESDFNQLDIRLRGKTRWYKQIILSFNPISLTSWLKKRFFDTPDKYNRVLTHKSTYKDNRFLPEEDIRTLEGFKETDPYYYQVYALGQWGVTGKTVFDAKAISERLEHLKKPVRQGRFVYDDNGLTLSNIQWLEEEDGPVKIWHTPKKGQPYVIGGDTAGGTMTGDGKDWFVGQVVDNVTGRQAAILRQLTDEDLYARQMFCLGMYYNTALLAVEAIENQTVLPSGVTASLTNEVTASENYNFSIVGKLYSVKGATRLGKRL